MRIASVLAILLVVMACAPASDGFPALLSRCDPVSVSTACVGVDSIGACSVVGGSYQMALATRCDAEALGLDIGATAGGLAAVCVDGTDAVSGQSEARCACAAGARTDACNRAGTVLSHYECDAEGQVAKSSADEACPLGGECRCEAGACTCIAAACPATADAACRAVANAECAYFVRCMPSLYPSCDGVVSVSRKGAVAPSDEDCQNYFDCLEGLQGADCGTFVPPAACAAVIDSSHLDCDTTSTN